MVKFQISIHIEELDYLIQSIKTFLEFVGMKELYPVLVRALIFSEPQKLEM